MAKTKSKVQPPIEEVLDLTNLWTVYINIGRYDNNMYVRAKNEKQAIKIADNYVEEEGDGGKRKVHATRLIDDEDLAVYFLDDVKEKDEDALKLLEGKIDGYCYDSGT